MRRVMDVERMCMFIYIFSPHGESAPPPPYGDELVYAITDNFGPNQQAYSLP